MVYRRTYIMTTFEWDRRKAARNLAKHSVDFADAVEVFYDESAISLVEETREEERLVTLGLDALGRLLVVVSTRRRDSIRVISARKATKAEMRDYGEGR